MALVSLALAVLMMDSAPGTPRKSKKRPRSRSGTPNSTSSNGNGTAEYDDDMLRSPLAKRKRVAQERTSSGLKNSLISSTPKGRSREPSADIGSPPVAWEEDAVMSEGGTDAGEEEFDFLAGEMEEEMEEDDDDDDDDDDDE